MGLANHESLPIAGKVKTSPLAPTERIDAMMRSNNQNRSATHQYQRAQVESASPTRLIVLLYEGAIRFCSLAQDAMQKRDLEAQNLNLIRAQRIIAELLASLNRTAGGEVALNLARIYAHMLAELVRANMYDDLTALSQVIVLLTEMRTSWIEIDRLQSADPDEKSQQDGGYPDNNRTAVPPRSAGAQAGSRTVRPIQRSIQPPIVRAASPVAASRLEDRLA